ncbi:MAG: hypothetical protein QW743_08820 [Candidatus Methanomethylicia archaeon]|nr:hypothetical protein [Candidatus Rehaiarchaeum fermentans]
MAKLYCMICEYRREVPMHCGIEMEYAQKGVFRKIDILKCKICGAEQEIPLHCGIPMLYFDEDYFPISKLTEREIEEMRRLYS